MRPIAFLVLLSLGCASPSRENVMKLELETKTADTGDQVDISATLRNTGTVPARILVEFRLFRAYATVTDDKGATLVGRDSEAAAGARVFEPGNIKTRLLKPGEGLEVAGWGLVRSAQSAFGSTLSWELNEVTSKTLTVELAYEVTAAHAEIARENGVPDATVGRWTAKPVTVRFRK